MARLRAVLSGPGQGILWSHQFGGSHGHIRQGTDTRVAWCANQAYRELIEGNYRIVYRVSSGEFVEILTVFHGARLLRLEGPG
jgi:hypothetical protein